MLSYGRWRASILLSDSKKDVIYLLCHLLSTLAKLAKPGGGRPVIAENLLLKQHMFNDATSGQGWPEQISSDNDPLFQYQR